MTKGFGGSIGKLPVDNLPEHVKSVIDTLDEGAFSAPVIFKNEPTEMSYRIIYKKEVIEAHEPTLENDYDMLEKMAAQSKKEKLYENWLAELREELYWEIVD
jgi:hypothetical protein